MSQHPISRTTSQDVLLHCLDQWARPVDIRATLDYRPSDPYAVWITFHASGSDVSWAMGRTLLLEGMVAPAGQGDVRLWPSIDERQQPVVVMDFHSPDGRLVAQADAAVIDRFLTRSMELVPLGAESEHLDMDAVLTGLLQESGPQ